MKKTLGVFMILLILILGFNNSNQSNESLNINDNKENVINVIALKFSNGLIKITSFGFGILKKIVITILN